MAETKGVRFRESPRPKDPNKGSFGDNGSLALSLPMSLASSGISNPLSSAGTKCQTGKENKSIPSVLIMEMEGGSGTLVERNGFHSPLPRRLFPRLTHCELGSESYNKGSPALALLDVTVVTAGAWCRGGISSQRLIKQG